MVALVGQEYKLNKDIKFENGKSCKRGDKIVITDTILTPDGTAAFYEVQLLESISDGEEMYCTLNDFIIPIAEAKVK